MTPNGSAGLRWINLVAAVLLLICTGSIYAFSVFSGPLAELRGWSGTEVTLGFTISAALSPVPMILGGKLVDLGHARASMLVGGLLFGLAFIGSGLIPSLIGFYFAYGLLGGLGAGFAYAGALGNVIRYFPDRRGLATGLVTAGNGAAAVIMAPLAGALIASQGVSLALFILGAGFLAVTLLCLVVVRTAPADYRPAGWTPPPAVVRSKAPDLDWRGMLSHPVFYVLLFIMAAGATSGLMIAANASQIGQGMFGLSATTAAVYVGLYSLSNASGRFVWGAVSDRIGRLPSLICIFVLVALALFLLSQLQGSTAFLIGILGVGIAFGGIMGVFPALCIEQFGARNFGTNYGILFTGYSIAALAGPRLGAAIGDAYEGNFGMAFLIATVLSLVGAAVTIAFWFYSRGQRAGVVPEK
ncbi:MAG: MFS transporter [Pelagibacterium sp. SCN 64-44]|nr:MAG: MFS transporter [Pelagibacterium sp. SCN 64-44]